MCLTGYEKYMNTTVSERWPCTNDDALIYLY